MAHPQDICHSCGFQRQVHNDGHGGGPCDAFEECWCDRAPFVGQIDSQNFVDAKRNVWRLLLAPDLSPDGWTHVHHRSWKDRKDAEERWRQRQAGG